jgi:putative chitinase
MQLLSPDILTKIAPTIKGSGAINISAWHNEICPLYGINTPDILHEFLANELHESKEFSQLSESLNYSIKGLRDTFAQHRITDEQCKLYGRGVFQKAKQQDIANIVYGGVWGKKNLGNTQPNDGYNFRGSGPIQITGRSNVTLFTDYYNKLTQQVITPDKMAEMLRTDIKMGIHSACWIFAVSKQLIDEAIDDKMTEVVKRINGGLIGLPERMAYYTRCKMYII